MYYEPKPHAKDDYVENMIPNASSTLDYYNYDQGLANNTPEMDNSYDISDRDDEEEELNEELNEDWYD